MKDKEAMAMALEALEYIDDGANNQGTHTGISWRCVSTKAEPAIAALKERLADPMREVQRLGQEIEQEPVAWWNNTGTHIDLNVSGRGTPLYTHPPQRTEQETDELQSLRQFRDAAFLAHPNIDLDIEAAHDIKEDT
jgi:hypothetical protein